MTSKKQPAKKRSAKPGTRPDAVAARVAVFADVYVRTGNGTQAAIDAGFSPKTAGSQANRMLKRADVCAAIEHRRKELAEAADLNDKDLARALRQNLLFDPRSLYRPDGTLKRITELDADTAANLTGIEVVEEEIVTGTGSKRRVTGKLRTAKLKWEGKAGARDQLARIIGAYEKDNRQRGDPLAQLVQALQGKGSALPVVPE